ncbi:phosphotransferase [Arenivirga flava]|uniref:Aminoglycoside phosphotransferase domain-containing protein n=1 Tax=Arenivirga flava TaxID=1930060 RepID=A0AA37U9H1_9MICO|nr:phosphotransferase [Arenivirga flava]GMA27159.1 hypothetical protein GCM10025874_04120 [Arenivirga flava]
MVDHREILIDGDLVCRPRAAWTETIHALLHHLRASDLPVPEPVRVDEVYEYVRLVPGDAGADAWNHQVTTDAVASAGALLRRVHDATATWRPPRWALWAVPAEGGSIICHGDPQPANFAWRDAAAVGLFDWDVARPAERLSDVAYALERLAPFETDSAELRRRGFGDDLDRRARIDAFLDGYGWQEPIDVVDVVIGRQERAIDEVRWLGERG